MGKLVVSLADDHSIVANGIATLLRQSPDVKQVHVFSNGHDLFQSCLNQKTDCVFLDVNMTNWDGRKTLIEIRKKIPSIRCFMLSMLNEKHIIEDCISKGASGYLNKDCTLDELKEALRSAPGEIYYSNEVLKVLSGVRKQSLEFQLTEPLSEREKEILVLLCDGLSPKEVADKIFLSVRTVETHKTNIMQKFNVSTVGKLISIAIKNNFV
jgi:two-component system response regulator DegU